MHCFFTRFCNGFAPLSNILEVGLIHEWYNKDWKVKFQHVLREGNKDANYLAKSVTGGLNELTILEGPPKYAKLDEDAHNSMPEHAVVSNQS